MSFEHALITGIVALASAVGILFRTLLSVHAAAERDRKDASRLIFALMQQSRANYDGEKPPPTVSTPEAPHFGEAKQLASRALNGELEQLLRTYLASSPPGPMGG